MDPGKILRKVRDQLRRRIGQHDCGIGGPGDAAHDEADPAFARRHKLGDDLWRTDPGGGGGADYGSLSGNVERAPGQPFGRWRAAQDEATLTAAEQPAFHVGTAREALKL